MAKYAASKKQRVDISNNEKRVNAEKISLDRAKSFSISLYRKNILKYNFLFLLYKSTSAKSEKANLDYTNFTDKLDLHKHYKFDVVAISSFVDYLETGRCFEIYGPRGCIDTFETEKLQKQILTQLDAIEKDLKTIIQNQYNIGQALLSINKIVSDNLNMINNKLDDIDLSLKENNDLLNQQNNLQALGNSIMIDMSGQIDESISKISSLGGPTEVRIVS